MLNRLRQARPSKSLLVEHKARDRASRMAPKGTARLSCAKCGADLPVWIGRGRFATLRWTREGGIIRTAMELGFSGHVKVECPCCGKTRHIVLN